MEKRIIVQHVSYNTYKLDVAVIYQMYASEMKIRHIK